MAISPFIDIFSITCDAIDCKESGEYEREIIVLDVFNEPFTFTGYFCSSGQSHLFIIIVGVLFSRIGYCS
jgi:hypothetical protein